jgi:hypothetical protein
VQSNGLTRLTDFSLPHHPIPIPPNQTGAAGMGWWGGIDGAGHNLRCHPGRQTMTPLSCLIFSFQDTNQPFYKIESIFMNQCLKCKSGNVFAGKIGRPISVGWGTAIFKPDIKVPFLAAILGAGPTCNEEAFACLDCGFVWSSLSAQDLIHFITRCGWRPKPDA